MSLEIWNYIMSELLSSEISQLQMLIDLADFFEGEIIEDFILKSSIQIGENHGNNARTSESTILRL